MIKKIVCVVLAIAALALTLLYGTASRESSISKLEAQQQTGMVIAGAAAGASAAVALFPDDSTTPIADQIANVASYLVIADIAIMLEMFIVNAAPEVSGICAAAALLFFGIALVRKHSPRLHEAAARLLILSMCFIFIVPASLWLDDKIDQTLGTTALMNSVTEETAEEETEDSGLWSRIMNALSDLTDTVSNAAQIAIEKLNAFIKAVAALLLTTCVVPVITILLLYSVCKWAVRGIADLLVQAGLMPPEEKPLAPKHSRPAGSEC